MERTLEQEGDGTILWKKKGGGAFILGRRMIKPGQTFRAKLEEIPLAFRDLVIPLESIEEKPTSPLEVVKPVYTLKPRGKSKSLFDVVDGNGKVLNEKALQKNVAENLIEDLLR